MLLTDAVQIWRAPGGDYHIEWDASAPDTRVLIEAVAASAPVEAHYAEPPQYRARVSGLPPARRHYFRLRDQHGNEVLAPERRLGLEGSPNFRDFGGYATADGRRVQWGYLFRSGHLARLTDPDLELLASLGLDMVFDFRQEAEQQHEPSRLPAANPPRVHSLPILPGNNSGFLQQLDGPIPGPEVMFEFMVTVNRELANEEAGVYRRMFAEILARDDARYLVHCAAGKDRTGFAAALMLLALGVPEQVVIRDYLLSSRFYNAEAEVERARVKYGMNDSDSAAIMPMLRVDEAYLRAALDSIDERYPDIESYLEEVMGVGAPERAELRRRYLEP
ncbi:tyrosine-protein phosphatase [Parahaliea mediterranea]|uniref:Tyrosine-protein phosphatase n=1 Tax=Parahaliea mediterranea TaxID=651086 RepID=A0A939DHD3_9GAMM|nr:tyrosine-protein phosphatase [Parahaliea mediterranea]MBN7798293.1 tyrosine-protein phosphatase [Parahaliea mediterranea]